MRIMKVLFIFSTLSLLTISSELQSDTEDLELKKRIEEKTKEITSREDFNIENLPVISETKQASETCPDIEEIIRIHRLDVEDDDGTVYSVRMAMSTPLDISYETVSLGDAKRMDGVFHSVFVRPYLNCLQADSEILVNIVKEEHIKPWNGKEYNFSVPLEELAESSLYGEVGQPREVDERFFKGQLKNGFFIEAGAHDFETNSDTLYYELEHGWTGLLVEAHPLSYQLGSEKNRRVRSVRTCLSTSGGVETMNFDLSGSVRNETTREAMAGLVKEANKDTIQMQCFPLYTLLLALGNPTVHYFSLDIEGAEFPVLTSIPWDKVHSSA